MKSLKKVILTTTVLLLCISASAQSGWNWGQEVDKAKEKNVIYTDALKAKKYKEALEPLNWLLTNTPDLNPSIYINGVQIYEALAKKATDPALKDQHIQKALELHDTRVKYYPEDKADIMDRKSLFAYRYYSKNKEKYPYLYELYNENFELNGANMNSGNLVAYMNVIYKYRFAGGDLSDEEVIEKYSEISDALEEQKSRVDDAKKARYNKYLGQVDKLLTATGVKISCEFVEEKLGPKLKEEENNLLMAKKIFGLMLKGKCIDSPLALEAAGLIQDNEPTYSVAKFLGQKNEQKGNTEKAQNFYKEAASLAEENSDKADMYVRIAQIHKKNGQKATARSTARRALSFDPSFSDAYELIGDLYYYSFEDCAGKQSIVDDRAVYIAAYDQYKKAGSSAKMKAAKAQFPSIGEIFGESKEEGQAVTVGCWINTTVKLERRPSSN